MFAVSTRATPGLNAAPIIRTKFVPTPAPRPLAPRGSNRARALLLERPAQEPCQQQANILENFMNMVISWLEPPLDAAITDDLPEYLTMDEPEGAGHGAVWGHSHIADRLATEPSPRMTGASYDL